MINFDDFAKVELRVGIVLEAEEVPGSEKLIKQMVDFGELGQRQILSGIKKFLQVQKSAKLCYNRPYGKWKKKI